jgi:hypothetical protein
MTDQHTIGEAIDPTGVHYHLLLTRGGTRDAFDKLVAAESATLMQDEWRGVVTSPDKTSAIEADARLARWSRAEKSFAIRITRTDDERWWLAIHSKGERLFAMVHHFGPPAQLEPIPGVVTNAGRDPLIDIVASQDSNVVDVLHKVASQRSEQLKGALFEGGLTIAHEKLSAILTQANDGTGGIPALLILLGADKFCALLTERRTGPTPQPSPLDLGRVAKQALVGCAAPIVAGIISFLVLIRIFVRLHWPSMLALIASGVGAFAAARLTRRTMGLWRSGRYMQRYMRLEWAVDSSGNAGVKLGFDPSRLLNMPLPPALNTWGGLFYLLRDIGFLSGIARPSTQVLTHTEAWAMGPPALVTAMNRVAIGQTSADPLYEAAQGLVELRAQLLEQHLADEPIEPRKIEALVRDILRPAITTP